MSKFLNTYFAFNVKGTPFFNALYIFKIVIYILGYIDFNLGYNLLAFTLLCIHFKHKVISKVLYPIFVLLTIAVFYHDSYLPSIEQMLAQSTNLKGFSLSYMLEFLYDFINFKLIFGLIAGVLVLKFLNRYVRSTTVVLILMISTAIVNYQHLKQNLNQEEMVTINRDFIAANKNNEQDLVLQRGNYTQSNLTRYLEQFYKKEQQKHLPFIQNTEDQYVPFNIVYLQVDGLSNENLTLLNVKEHAALKRFDIYLTNFNSAATTAKETSIRALNANCGQQETSELSKEPKDKCLTIKNLQQIGYSTQSIFDTKLLGNALFDTLNKQVKLDNPIDLYVPTKLINSSKVFNVDPLFRMYLNNYSSMDFGPRFTYIHLSSLTLKDNAYNFDARLKDFLLKLDSFMDSIQASNTNTLLIMVPGESYSTRNDKTQLSRTDIAATRLTKATAFVKFIGSTYLHSKFIYKNPTSYMAITDLINRVIKNNAFYDLKSLSLEALSEDLTQTSTVSENQNNTTIIFKQKEFYKTKDGKWKEYFN